MLICVSGHYPILGMQMLYFLDPVLNDRAELAPPSEFVTLESGRVYPQKPVELARHRISKPGSVPSEAATLTNSEISFFEATQIKGA
jgi:hypothetical protein